MGFGLSRFCKVFIVCGVGVGVGLCGDVLVLYGGSWGLCVFVFLFFFVLGALCVGVMVG